MREYPDNHRRLPDGDDGLELATTLRAVFAVDVEHAGVVHRPWHNRRAQPGIGGEHSVKTDQVQARARHQSRQALHEFERRHADVRGALTPGAFELQHDVSSVIAAEPFFGDRRARNVAAQEFELLALMRAATHPGVQAEAVRIGAQRQRVFLVPGGNCAQAQLQSADVTSTPVSSLPMMPKISLSP